MHILIKTLSDKRLFVDRNLVIRWWGQSDVYIERIPTSKDVERIAKYLNPFTNSKKFRRLPYYERNFRIYNCSRGIVKPETIKVSFNKAIQYLSKNNYVKHNFISYDIVADMDDKNSVVLNSVSKIKYKKNI